MELLDKFGCTLKENSTLTPMQLGKDSSTFPIWSTALNIHYSSTAQPVWKQRQLALSKRQEKQSEGSWELPAFWVTWALMCKSHTPALGRLWPMSCRHPHSPGTNSWEQRYMDMETATGTWDCFSRVILPGHLIFLWSQSKALKAISNHIAGYQDNKHSCAINNVKTSYCFLFSLLTIIKRKLSNYF